ncbi:acetoacetate decarboxylase family protein [Sphingobium sp. B2]|uniref:acetoacetate decarboxylase family protein n=1 Tax=Sphingobium sp. B2 TaxID=2583228 RepID=UPI0021BD9372|nr:acetoacetate decarboxylase family protein [Sphingobium sp. B2]
MVIVSYKADPAAIREILPPGLTPHPEGRVVLNMWDQNDAGSSSGFGNPGPVSVTYLAIEVEGHDTWTADGTVSAPGRYFAGQWISAEDNGGFAEFGRLSCGVGSEPVSYTHLDVYKRQQWRFRRVRKTGVWCWVGACLLYTSRCV